MGSTVAAQLHPYLSYLLVGQLALFGGAIVVGCFLLFRRLLSKEKAPDFSQDAQGVADEIHEEIKRLRTLRDRLSPKFAGEAVDQAVQIAAPGAAPAISPSGDGAPGVDRASVEREVEAKWAAKISELEGALALAQTAAVAGSAAAPSAEETDKLKAEKSDFEVKIAGLEKALSEYQIFEEDFALVKKYKEENDRLRAQLSATGGAEAGPGPKMTEQDIASLFGDIGGEAAKAASTPPPAEASAPAPAEEKGSLPQPATEAEAAPASPDAELEKLLAEAQQEKPEEKVIPADKPTDAGAADRLKRAEEMAASMETASIATVFQDSKVDVAPAAEKAAPAVAPKLDLDLDESDAEAATEADDEVMAEFEKLLGEGGNKT